MPKKSVESKDLSPEEELFRLDYVLDFLVMIWLIDMEFHLLIFLEFKQHGYIFYATPPRAMPIKFIWPRREFVDSNRPACFKKEFPKTRM